jgi:hypothetical protein
MRLFFLLMMFPTFISCGSPKERTDFLPKEYRFPTKKIGSGKTFVFSKVGAENETSLKDLQLITESGKQFFLSKQYSDEAKFDSSKSSDIKLIETFTFMSPDNSNSTHLPIKGEIKEDKIIDNGTKFGQSVSKIVYTGNENIVTINSQEEYLKDTVLTWQGKQMNCIVTRMKSTIEFTSKKNPFAKQDIEYSGDSYFAKDIGVVRYTTQTKKDFSIWELTEIKDM